LKVPATATIATDPLGYSLDMTAAEGQGLVTEPFSLDEASQAASGFTVTAWLQISEAEDTGGILALCDAVSADGATAGSSQPAFRVGYNDRCFECTMNTDTGEGCRLRGTKAYEKGQWTQVSVVYDGDLLQLYVNGKLDAERPVRGKVAYPQTATIAIGGGDGVTPRPLRGKLREVSIYDLAARAKWVAHQFSHGSQLVALRPDARNDEPSLIIKPYLQYGTQDGMTVMWQTNVAGSSRVHYGETDACEKSVETEGQNEIHEVRIEGLEAETQYFYRVETTAEGGGSVKSSTSTFTTAVREETPFAFAVISDTQTNDQVAKQVATHAWAQRPSFLLHPGDLVETGVNDSHWTQQFFPSMHPLVSRVPFYPVLGNHEQNARNYYDYMSLPDPEYYYEFKYGNAHFFMIDTNRNVGPDSEQYKWLDKKLDESDATWKFACHHHPPYSSDENDYGDLWKTNKSTRGDQRARQLSKLYDKHGVDIVWNGHIHSYERTWPVRDGKAVPSDGPIYMIVGGGGGGLETPGPYRPFFQNQVRRGHHYVMVHINGPQLELRSYDIEDKLFDTTKLEKSR